MKKKKYL